VGEHHPAVALSILDVAKDPDYQRLLEKYEHVLDQLLHVVVVPTAFGIHHTVSFCQ